jgi:hypothetical protein
MIKTKSALYLSLLLICLTTLPLCARSEDSLGQTIQISTRLHSFVGRPSWLLIIRDVDNGQNIPYIFDFKRGENTWVALTYGRNYLITVSQLQFAPYHNNPYKENPYTQKTINNFCQLESHGRIIRGESLVITIEGHLSPYNSYECHVSSYREPNI